MRLIKSRPQARFSDCVSKDPHECEIFIVPRGTIVLKAKSMRDRMTQAVLPITSAIPTVKGNSVYSLLDSGDVLSIVACLGAGLSLDGRYREDDPCFGLRFLRYDRIIIVATSSSKDRHIRNEAVSLIFRIMRPVLEKGHVYYAPAQAWRQMDEGEFYSRAMDPKSRCIVQLRSEKTIAPILERLDLIDSLSVSR